MKTGDLTTSRGRQYQKRGRNDQEKNLIYNSLPSLRNPMTFWYEGKLGSILGGRLIIGKKKPVY